MKLINHQISIILLVFAFNHLNLTGIRIRMSLIVSWNKNGLWIWVIQNIQLHDAMV